MMQNRKGKCDALLFFIIASRDGSMNLLVECPGSQPAVVVIIEKVDLNWKGDRRGLLGSPRT